MVNYYLERQPFWKSSAKAKGEVLASYSFELCLCADQIGLNDRDCQHGQ